MFGYVRPFKPEMKFCEFDAYKSIYCALCKVLGEKYGWAARMTLSYDGTFIALLGTALLEERATVCPGRCVCNPLNKCNYYEGEDAAVQYAAAVNVLLSVGSCRDTIADAKGVKRWGAWLALLFLRRAEKKAKVAEPETAALIEQQLTAQRTLEDKQCGVPDQAAEPTAEMLSYFLTHLARNEEQKRILSVIGYQLGRWVYLADALDDLSDDLEKGQYNPLISRFQLTKDSSPADREAAKHYAEQVLCANEARLSSAFELLSLQRLQPVLYNLIYEGLPAMRKTLPRPRKKRKQEEQHERSI